MPRVASALAAAALVLAAAGCGGSSHRNQHSLDAFFTRSARGRAWAKRFPQRPGSRPCSAYDRQLRKTVPATCSTDVSPVKPDRLVVSLTESWSHGTRARTWFVFIRPDGTIVSVTREGVAP